MAQTTRSPHKPYEEIKREAMGKAEWTAHERRMARRAQAKLDDEARRQKVAAQLAAMRRESAELAAEMDALAGELRDPDYWPTVDG